MTPTRVEVASIHFGVEAILIALGFLSPYAWVLEILIVTIPLVNVLTQDIRNHEKSKP